MKKTKKWRVICLTEKIKACKIDRRVMRKGGFSPLFFGFTAKVELNF
jgi:hypothetical protein